MRWDFWRRGPSKLQEIQEKVDLLREAFFRSDKVQQEHEAKIVALQAARYAPEQHSHAYAEPGHGHPELGQLYASEQHPHAYAQPGHGHAYAEPGHGHPELEHPPSHDLVREESPLLLLTENLGGTVTCPDCHREFNLQDDLNITNHANLAFRCSCGCELMVRASALGYTIEIVSVDIATRKASGP